MDTIVKIALIFWSALFVPWFPFMMLSGMAFDAGPHWYTYGFVWSMWTYPLLVVVIFIFRNSRIARFLVLLPLLNVIGCFFFGSFPRPY
ncbi:MAG TPA: hypothetical protein VK724_02655 [Bryobacteraceae bacterium]|jgi:hypothetical protein|nr:hypothetical protein [Bryobacteraceae bacterium]